MSDLLCKLALDELRDLKATANVIKLHLIMEIEKLDENPLLHPLGPENGKGPKCYTLRLNQLTTHGNWSAEYHHFETQYKMITEYLEKQDALSIPDKLEKLLKEGGIRKTTERFHFKFHPEVVFNIKKLIGIS